MMPQQELSSLSEDIFSFDDWEDRYAYIIDLGKSLPPFDACKKTDIYKLQGCVSNVWMSGRVDESGVLFLEADSDALIVRGLLAVLLRIYAGKYVKDILSLMPDQVITTLGFKQYLTVGRHNGFRSAIDKIRDLAASCPS